MGRKNWLFCWSEVGARQVGTLQSLLTTCGLHQIDPYTHLVDELQRAALHPAWEVGQLPHACGRATSPPTRCAQTLNMAIDIDGLSFEELPELNQRVVARLKMLKSMQVHVDMMQFNLGQHVSFAHCDGHILDTLVRYNRKTVTVVTDDGQRWNISPHPLSPVKDAGTAKPGPTASRKYKQLR